VVLANWWNHQGKTSPTFPMDAKFVIKNFTAESANKKDFESFIITLHWQTPSTPELIG